MTTCSPGRDRRSRASDAAMPLEKAIPWRADSSEASVVSRTCRVGLLVRAYSKPRCDPTASCANVEARWIAGTTAPVPPSGSWPAWIALVSKPALSSISTSTPSCLFGRAGLREEGERVRPGHDPDRVPAVEHEDRRRLLEPADGEIDRLAGTDGRQRWAHHLADRPVEQGRVAEGGVHQVPLVHGPDHFRHGERRLRLHDGQLGHAELLHQGDGGA